MKSYDDLWLLRDKRVVGYPLMSSIVPSILISAAYVFLVKFVGPRLMKSREPIEMKNLMKFYNIFQAGFSAWMFHQFLKGGWWNSYNLTCQEVDHDATPGSKGMIMVNVIWWFYISKFVDFLDTFFIIIRKKDRQLSFLHVFHHTTTPMLAWVLVQWTPTGHATLIGLINSFIHTLMYSYYFLCSLGPKVQPYLWWKKYLTSMQIAQFIIVIIHESILVGDLVTCDHPKGTPAFVLVMIVLNLTLFLNFYTQNYVKKPKKHVE